MVLVAKDIVEKDFLSLPRNTTALEAARQMKAKSHGFVIIAAEGGNPEGIVTEWDYLAKIVAEARDPGRVKLAEIMSGDLVTAERVRGPGIVTDSAAPVANVLETRPLTQ